MDIEYYRNFIAIVEAGSISAAAKRINIAQPALSNQLKNLQERLGSKLLLVQRGGHKIELTDAGSILYNKAKYLCSMEDDIAKELAAVSAGFSGTLRVSLSPSNSIHFINSYLSGYARLYPKVNYELYEVPIAEQTQQLLNGITEIGVANAPLKQPQRFESILQRRERLVALFHQHSPYLRPGQALALGELDQLPLCLSRGCSELFLNVCTASRLYPNILSINTTKLSTIAWAQQNLGVAVVPAPLEESCPQGLVRKEIADERLYLEKTLSVVRGRFLSPVAKAFIKYVLANYETGGI